MAVLRVTRVVVAAAVVAAATARTTGAQTTPAVTQVQSLSFGTMIPGKTEAVATSDGWRRGTVRLDGTGQWSVHFSLPTALTASTGESIPLTFSTTSAAYSTARTSSLTSFDPTTGTKVTLTSGKGTAWLYLGGSAAPAALQKAGTYSATVVVVIAPPNM